MSEAVGSISLDILLNSTDFERKVRSITADSESRFKSSFAKIGGFIAAGLSAAALVSFGKKALDLGSDLQEVQNVVDVTFTTMSDKVDAFSKSAIESFGLSETVAKKYMGTFGAMGKAFGFTEQEAYNMSAALTGLSGDVASFYNISTDEAYTKLKSVFTGETETLKDLGIVMTQNALDAYAMASGYGKTTAAMTEAQKVALRFKFVQEQLTLASGDFIRTGDGWANQVRVMKLQWEQFQATTGQGLINLFTPVLQVINKVIAKLQVLANYFKSWTEMITGKKSETNAISGAAAGISETTAATDQLADSTAGVGESAKKAKKELKGLMGFDEINKLTSTGGEEKELDDTGVDAFDLSGLDKLANLGEQTLNVNVNSNAQDLFDKIKKEFMRLKDLFMKGFKIGFGMPDFSGIMEDLQTIWEALKNIFTSPEVLDAMRNFVDAFVFNLGKIIGSIASIGVTIAKLLIGGIASYLEENVDFIKTRIASMFNVGAEILDLIGDAFVTIADIFSVFGSEIAQRILGNLIEVFSNGVLGLLDLGLKLGRDLLNVIVQPFKDNKDLIKDTLMNLFEPIETITESVAGFVTNTFIKIHEVYDTYLAPAFQNIADGLSYLMEVFLNVLNDNIIPALEYLANGFSNTMSEHVQPFVDKFLELFGMIAAKIGELWKGVLAPFIGWVAEKLGPVFEFALKFVGEIFLDTVNSIFDLLGGIIDFIVGVFTLDWSKAWDGIKAIFVNLFELFILSKVKSVFKGIKTVFEPIVKFFGDIFKGVKKVVVDWAETLSLKAMYAWDKVSYPFKAVGKFFNEMFKKAADGVESKLNSFKGFAEKAWSAIKKPFSKAKSWFSDIFNGVKEVVKKPINWIIDGLNKFIRGINKIQVPDWVHGVGGKGLNIGEIPKLAQGGYVKANQPQLALIGDNKTQGEIVAPESKMLDMILTALRMYDGAGGNKDTDTGSKQPIELVVQIGDKKLAKVIIDNINQLAKQEGRNVFKFI